MTRGNGRNWKRLAGLGVAVALGGVLVGVSTEAQAKDEFEDGFKDELGRIAAHEAVGVGRHVLADVLLGGQYYHRQPVYHYGRTTYHYDYPAPVYVVYPEHHHRHHKHHKHHGHHHYYYSDYPVVQHVHYHYQGCGHDYDDDDYDD